VASLEEVSTHLSNEGIRHAMFFEDDVQDYTAICTENLDNGTRKKLRRYKLLE